jgi:predicted ABC-type ATPase
MFAGPNGSGKSTMKSVLRAELLGAYINPDDIEKEIDETSWLDLRAYNIACSKADLLAFYDQSTLLKKAELQDEINNIGFDEYKHSISFHDVEVNSYWASVTADFIRYQLLKQHQSFTFETVMSSPDKIELLAKAQALGYKTYLYYVATEDPQINVKRVHHRVTRGGHNVPTDKIISRYYRSLDLLLQAIKHTNRAYLFDNSGENQTWVAEITNGKELSLRSNTKPLWFEKYILNKL